MTRNKKDINNNRCSVPKAVISSEPPASFDRRICYFILLSITFFTIGIACILTVFIGVHHCISRNSVSSLVRISVFSRGHATLELPVSVGTSLRNIVKIVSGSRITAPAQPSATGLPCIRPCSVFRCAIAPL